MTLRTSATAKSRLAYILSIESRGEKVPDYKEFLQRSLIAFNETVREFFKDNSVSMSRKNAVINLLDPDNKESDLYDRVDKFTNDLDEQVKNDFSAQLLKTNARIARVLSKEEIDDYINDEIADSIKSMKKTLAQFSVHI
jgi:monomeric isocitrate dehydrogenase